MLMALMGGGNGNGTPPQANPMQQQAAQMPQNPLLNGMNASLGGSGGTSLGTPQDAYSAMFQQTPPMGAAY